MLRESFRTPYQLVRLVLNVQVDLPNESMVPHVHLTYHNARQHARFINKHAVRIIPIHQASCYSIHWPY